MNLSKEMTTKLENVLKESLRKKFKAYKPETNFMPFHTRLLGKDRMALSSSIHSLSTNFGTSFYEPISEVLAIANFKEVKIQVIAGNKVSEEAQKVIQEIMDNLTTARKKPMKLNEIERIRSVCQSCEMRIVKPTKIDVFLRSHDDEVYFIDLKTVKPNKGDFISFKRTLLEWVACYLADNPETKINTLIAMPYNPYEPKPYARWTMAGMLDLDNELKVADEYWDFLGGQGTYTQLLDVFERVGIELRAEIDDYFKGFDA